MYHNMMVSQLYRGMGQGLVGMKIKDTFRNLIEKTMFTKEPLEHKMSKHLLK